MVDEPTKCLHEGTVFVALVAQKLGDIGPNTKKIISYHINAKFYDNYRILDFSDDLF